MLWRIFYNVCEYGAAKGFEAIFLNLEGISLFTRWKFKNRYLVRTISLLHVKRHWFYRYYRKQVVILCLNAVLVSPYQSLDASNDEQARWKDERNFWQFICVVFNIVLHEHLLDNAIIILRNANGWLVHLTNKKCANLFTLKIHCMCFSLHWNPPTYVTLWANIWFCCSPDTWLLIFFEYR